MSNPKSTKTDKFCTDTFMKTLWKCLARDFRTVCGPSYMSRQENALDTTIKTFREVSWPSGYTVPPYIFKRDVQLANLFKRYQFSNDLYTEAELQERTNSKFLEDQNRIASTPINRTAVLHAVVGRARSIIAEILGEYDEEEHFERCRFGKRASVGCPARSAYIDEKLMYKDLTGSHEHITWMQTRYLPSDPLLGRMWKLRFGNEPPTFTLCDTLAQINVAKSFKILRGISPNTLIGSFYTYGLGRMFQERLKVKAKLNIKRLQEKHKKLAQRYSKSRTHVTADLSSASQSFCTDVVNMLLPRSWYKACKKGRISKLSFADGSTISQASFMAMGIGFTFTLQTLLFYGLLKAIQELLNLSGKVSVYGDDLIYPSRMHSHVVSVFKALRFEINTEKTFKTEHFRESCGGDYYRGIDVRPFQPEGSSMQLSRAPMLAFIYKTYNGLLKRWDETEISGTIQFMQREILRCTNEIFQVPPYYPEYSGIRTTNPNPKDWYSCFAPIIWSPRHSGFKFKCLTLQAKQRYVASLDAYYWELLRSANAGEKQPYNSNTNLEKIEESILRQVLGFVERGIHGDYEEAPAEAIRWEKDLTRPKFRSKSGKMLVRRRATVALKAAPSRFVSLSGTASCWTKGISAKVYRP